jgi:hypothetical protein
MLGFSPEVIFYWTGCVFWWSVCLFFGLTVFGLAIVLPFILLKRCVTSLWTWIVCAKLKKYDLTQQEVYDAYQDAYNMSDMGKLLDSDQERENVTKFIKIFIMELEKRAAKHKELA